MPLSVHSSWDEFTAEVEPPRLLLFSKKATTLHWDVEYRPGDTLVFGSETSGLPTELMERYSDGLVRIPILPTIRSLNLANAASIVAYEALRQLDWSA